MSSPYYDQTLSKAQLTAMLQKVGARHSKSRSQPGILVYKLEGEGEGMVEAVSEGKYRLRLYRGKCAC